MRIIDADTHVDETEATWEYCADDERVLMPVSEQPPNLDPNRPPTRYWRIDERRQPRFIRDDQATQTTVETRELIDVDARVRDMDAMGIAVQVIYPTLFLVGISERADIDLALRRSYNRWLADRCERSRGRLRWVCLPPTLNMDQAVAELRFAKDHGACGLLKKGDREAGKWPSDPYFFPLYEEAERLDLPICFHIGSGVPDFTPAREFSQGRFMRLGLAPVHAFHSLILHGIPEQFPKLRFGFIEAGASWVPFALYDLKRRMERRPQTDQILSGPSYEVPPNVLEQNRLYVSIQVDEDLPYIMQSSGENTLLIGSDYTHNDPAGEMGFIGLLQQRVASGDLTQAQVDKILWDNPRRFYGL